MPTQLAFKNTPLTKTEALRQAKAHRIADQYIQGQWWGNGKGCALGCMFHSHVNGKSYFEVAQEQTNIPIELCHLQEQIFEGLPNDKAVEWNERFYKAIKVGADLSDVTPKLMLWLLEEELPQHYDSKQFPDVAEAIKKVVRLYKKVIAGKAVTDKEWSEASWAVATRAAAAWAAADAAAWATADAAARAAAWAARAAARAAAEASWAARAAAEASWASWAVYERIADKLIMLLDECHAN